MGPNHGRALTAGMDQRAVGRWKPTLAKAIGRSLRLAVIHLDQLRLVPAARVERSDEALVADIEDALSDGWLVLESNYFSCPISSVRHQSGASLCRRLL